MCEAFRRTRPARTAAPPREIGVNEVVGVDSVNIYYTDQCFRNCLNIIDYHTHFQLVIPMKDTAKSARLAYRQWLRFFGPPKILLNDLGSEFKQEFTAKAERDDTEVNPASLEMPSQRGLTERAEQILKEMLYKAMATHKPENFSEWLALVDITCFTKNRLLMRAGYSPIQRVMGYSLRLPGGLLSDGESDHAAASLYRLGDLPVTKAMEMRKAAAQAFHACDCEQAIRNAATAGPRPNHRYEVWQVV